MIISTNSSGLSNRLKSWVSAMRLASDAQVYWKVNEFIPVGFSQLFANECSVDEVPLEASVHNSWRLLILPEDEAHLPAGFSTASAGAHPIFRSVGKAWWNLRGRPTDRYRYMVFPKTFKKSGTRADARQIDLEYERIPEYFRKIYVPLFRKIKVRSEIIQRMDDWANVNLDESVIGVHIRTWRDYPHRYKKYHRPSMKRLSRMMINAESDDRFFVVSDSDDIIFTLKEGYGDRRIIHFARKTDRHESWQTPEGIMEDLIDMLLLARTHRMFASYLSTFSETAWWLGGATARVWVY